MADSFGPLDTLSVTVRAACRPAAPPAGLWRTTMPLGCSESTSWRATAKPAPWSCDDADSKVWPTTVGIPIGWSPRETLMRTLEPLFTRLFGVGNWATTVPASSFE